MRMRILGIFTIISLAIVPIACSERTEQTTKTVSNNSVPSDNSVPSEPEKDNSVYSSLIAGQWYDANPDRLRTYITELLAKAKTEKLNEVIALILPHAGYQYSGLTACKGILSTGDTQYKRIIILGTCHKAPLKNLISIPSVAYYETPLGKIPLDIDVLQELRKYPFFKEVPQAQQGEHSVEIQLPLLQITKKDFKLVPLICGHLDVDTTLKVADILKAYVDEHTLVIASSDFTHYGINYGYIPFTENIKENLQQLDMKAYEFIEKRDLKGFYHYLDETQITICGPYGIGILLSMLPKNANIKLIEYTRSGDIVNDYRNSVSYFSIAITGTWEKGEKIVMDTHSESALTKEEKKALLKLARFTLEYALEHRKLPPDNELPIQITETMKTPRAAFVTLKKHGDLRGCIGEIFATQPMYKSVIQNAYNAGFKDPRFYPITKDELPHISTDISLLTHPRKINHYNEIVLGKHGIIMRKGYYQALFLPQVAPEQNWNLQQTLEHLSMKAGLSPDAYKENAEFEVFEADVFGEEEL